jgi:hypothetical protein
VESAAAVPIKKPIYSRKGSKIDSVPRELREGVSIATGFATYVSTFFAIEVINRFLASSGTKEVDRVRYAAAKVGAEQQQASMDSFPLELAMWAEEMIGISGGNIFVQRPIDPTFMGSVATAISWDLLPSVVKVKAYAAKDTAKDFARLNTTMTTYLDSEIEAFAQQKGAVDWSSEAIDWVLINGFTSQTFELTALSRVYLDTLAGEMMAMFGLYSRWFTYGMEYTAGGYKKLHDGFVDVLSKLGIETISPSTAIHSWEEFLVTAMPLNDWTGSRLGETMAVLDLFRKRLRFGFAEVDTTGLGSQDLFMLSSLERCSYLMPAFWPSAVQGSITYDSESNTVGIVLPQGGVINVAIMSVRSPYAQHLVNACQSEDLSEYMDTQAMIYELEEIYWTLLSTHPELLNYNDSTGFVTVQAHRSRITDVLGMQYTPAGSLYVCHWD